MKRILLALLLMALPLAAQEDKKPEARSVPKVQKLFLLKYADPGQLSVLLRVFGANVIPNTEMHALAVESTQESMPAIEDAIKRLDVVTAAPRNIELVVCFLVGADSESPYGGPIPKDLDSVVSTLKNTFPFKDYRLMDVIDVRTRTGQRVVTNSMAGSVTLGTNLNPTQLSTSFNIDSSSISPDGTTVRLDRMRAQARVPYPTGKESINFQTLEINEDMDIKEGQKAVVGRVGISRDQALFLVLSAKVVP